MNQIIVFPVGSKVKFTCLKNWECPEGVVDRVIILQNNAIKYEVAYWTNECRNVVEVNEFEIEPIEDFTREMKIILDASEKQKK